MSKTPNELRYTASHEWVRLENDGSVTVGITDHAQEALGDLVFLELPELGKTYATHQEIAVVESVKAAADVYAPLAGKITAINTAAADAPETINQDPYSAWLFKMQPEKPEELDTLLNASTYQGLSTN